MSSDDTKNTDNEKKSSNDNGSNSVDLSETVAILDAGSQFGKVIDRRVRELNVESQLVPFATPADTLKQYKAIIISGGPTSVYADDAPKYDKKIFSIGIPVLGICYGMQMMAHQLEGTIETGHEREDGQFMISIDNKSKLFAGLKESIQVLLTHGDVVSDAGKQFKVIGKSKHGIISAIENVKSNLYGVQFHPEVDLTIDGKEIYKNFLYGICKCKGNYTLSNRKETAIKYIRKVVGNKNVLSLVSGGVDSSVCTALLNAALDSKQVFPVHIDSGLMRHKESENVYKALKDVGVDCHVEDACDDFLNGTTEIDNVKTCKLCETVEPEVKRKIIGDVFMKLCDKIVTKQYPHLKFEEMILAQGTLRPDLIESASQIANKGGTADVIKTHHNDTPLVRRLRDMGRVVEPLTDYHKDEVRALGEELGLPHNLVWRQPFPGPGLGIRVICTTKQAFETKEDDKIVETLKKEFETDEISCCLFGFRTVGVQGDGRTYSHCVGLSLKKNYNLIGDNNKDCVSKNIPWDKLYAMAKDIPRVIKKVNRCIFVFSKQACMDNDDSKLQSDFVSGQCKDVTETKLTKDVLDTLRECDRIVNDGLQKYKLVHTLSQVPVILFPSNFGENGQRSCCIRTFMTNDFMTGVPARIDKDIPGQVLQEMVIGISKVKGIERVAFDLTPKPPGTTEWE